jgi:preprotein translocase subunit Sec61beta
MVSKESTMRTGTPLSASAGLIRYYNPDPVILSSEPMLELSPTGRNVAFPKPSRS